MKRVEGKICKCGCGRVIPYYESHKYKMPDYIKGHGRKNRKNSLKHNEQIKQALKNGIDKECKYCNKNFYISKIKGIKRKYCSKECYSNAQKEFDLYKPSKERINKMVKTREKTTLKNGFYHSKETAKKISLSKIGDKNPSWNPLCLANIKRQIRKRDNYMCMVCSKRQKDKSLDVHHIDYDDTNNLYPNLITLCHNCHAKTNKTKRDYWITFFHSLLNDKYGYEYTKENEILIKLGGQNERSR